MFMIGLRSLGLGRFGLCRLRAIPIEPKSRRKAGELEVRPHQRARLVAQVCQASIAADLRRLKYRSNPRAAESLDFVTDRVGFDTFSQAFESLKKPSDQIKAMLEPH